jgi:DNA-binding transcriptional regulator YhcF (GntR family)
MAGLRSIMENTNTLQNTAAEHLSYKFQRLRERLREAITGGELAGKLPGERELAKRFKANPKTLSKALTDLAAEGLLDRSIGRGTYVRGSAPATEQLATRRLILADAEQLQSPLVDHLQRCGAAEVASSAATLRPSFISQFDSVIDISTSTPESFHRDLLVRGISVVLVGRESASFKLHAVLLDRPHAASRLTRDFILAGHQRILVVEETGDTTVSSAAQVAAQRYNPHAIIELASPSNIEAINHPSNTAILCAGEAAARQALSITAQHPQLAHVSISALGQCDGQPPCTGIYTSASDLALAASNLLSSGNMHRPTVLWLTGAYIDRQTTHPLPETPTALSA